MPKPVAFWYVLTSGLQVKRPIRKRVAFWYVLASGLQVKRSIGKPQRLTLNRSKEDGYEKEEEGAGSLMEQARHHLGYVGGLEGEKEQDGIC